MFLPASIIGKLDNLLGGHCQPYRILNDGWNETGYVAWHVPEIQLTPAQFDLLNEVLQRTAKLAKQDVLQNCGELDLDEWAMHLRMRFADEVPHLDKEVIEAAQPYLKNPYNPKPAPKRRTLLTKVRQLLAELPVIAYKSDLTWFDITETSFNEIVVAPTTDQFEIVRTEHTFANNRGLTTEEVITNLKILDDTYGIDITGASSGAVEFKLRRIPKYKEARELGQWLFAFAPNIYEPPTQFPKGQVALWWD